MTNMNPFKVAKRIRQVAWYIFFIAVGLWLICSCDQKELCYDHNHASNVKVTFNWQEDIDASPSSMFVYLFPRETNERMLKREFVGKDGGMAQALVGVSYKALGFNSNAKKTLFQTKQTEMEAISKDADMIEKIGLSTNQLPRAEGTEEQRMAMEADSLWSAISEKDILISLEENDNGEIYNLPLSPKRRFCRYKVRILNIDNEEKLSYSIAGSISGLAGGINLMTNEKVKENVTVPFSLSMTANHTLEGRLLCFGNSIQKDILNKLVIYSVLKDGTKWCYVYDVTKQIQEASDPYNIEIVLDKLPIPDKIEGHGGLTPGVSAWNVIEVSINM